MTTLRTAEELTAKLRTCKAKYSKDLKGGMAIELSQYMTVDQVLAGGGFPDETVAILAGGGPDAQKIRENWTTFRCTREAVLARAQASIDWIVQTIVRHEAIKAFDILNRLEIWMWLLGDTEHDLYTELLGDRAGGNQLGAPYVNAFMELYELKRPDIGHSDVFVAMVKGELCPWCAEGRDMGCVR